MEFRRIPFQFTSTDPAKRQAELQKRFGLPAKELYIDIANPVLMGARKKEPNSLSSSPRLQHRVPIFVEGMPELDKSSIDTNPTNVDAGQKSRVRNVPIEIENPDGSKRHRTLSGSCVNGNPTYQGSWFSNSVKPKAEPVTSKSSSGPKVCNIPIEIEGNNQSLKTKSPMSATKDQTPKAVPMQKNGCNVTKVNNSEKKVPPACQVSLIKIDAVLEKLKAYQCEVEELSETVKEKQYKYLDEMLTRLMLDLDNVETMGNENVRLLRKAAIKKVQLCIDLLELKVNENSQNQTESNAKLLEVEKESEVVKSTDDSECNVRESEAKSDNFVPDTEGSDAAEIKTDLLQVLSMETDAETIPVKNEVVERSRNIESEQNLAESNSNLSEVVKQVQSELEQNSDVGKMACVEGVKSVDTYRVNDPNIQESIISEVEIEGSAVDDKEVAKIQSKSCQEQSMEIDVAENMMERNEAINQLEKDCAVCDEPSHAVSSTGDTSTDVIAQNICVKEDEASCGNIPLVNTDSNFVSVPCEHSNLCSKVTGLECNKCPKEIVASSKLSESNVITHQV